MLWSSWLKAMLVLMIIVQFTADWHGRRGLKAVLLTKTIWVLSMSSGHSGVKAILLLVVRLFSVNH